MEISVGAEVHQRRNFMQRDPPPPPTLKEPFAAECMDVILF